MPALSVATWVVVGVGVGVGLGLGLGVGAKVGDRVRVVPNAIHSQAATSMPSLMQRSSPSRMSTKEVAGVPCLKTSSPAANSAGRKASSICSRSSTW